MASQSPNSICGIAPTVVPNMKSLADNGEQLKGLFALHL
jgi:hypothetical protein